VPGPARAAASHTCYGIAHPVQPSHLLCGVRHAVTARGSRVGVRQGQRSPRCRPPFCSRHTCRAVCAGPTRRVSRWWSRSAVPRCRRFNPGHPPPTITAHRGAPTIQAGRAL